MTTANSQLSQERISLCEVLDRVLNKGVVVTGEVVVSVADIELLYVGLQLIVTSVETMHQQRQLAGFNESAELGIPKSNEPVRVNAEENAGGSVGER